ncbi:MAG: hypothetical protein ACON4N_16410 [Myxococcota bacterium]
MLGAGLGLLAGAVAAVPLFMAGMAWSPFVIVPFLWFLGPSGGGGGSQVANEQDYETPEEIAACMETYSIANGFGYDDDAIDWGQNPAVVAQACSAAGEPCEPATIMTRAAAECVFSGLYELPAATWDPALVPGGEHCELQTWSLTLGFDEKKGKPRWRFVPSHTYQRAFNETLMLCGPDVALHDIHAVNGRRLRKKPQGMMGKELRQLTQKATRAATRACLDAYPRMTGGAREGFITKDAAACIVKAQFPPAIGCDQSGWTYELMADGGSAKARWKVTPDREPLEPHGSMFCDEGLVSATLDARTGAVVQQPETKGLSALERRALYYPHVPAYVAQRKGAQRP